MALGHDHILDILSDFMSSDIRRTCAATAGLVLLASYFVARKARLRQRHKSIPALGGSGFFQSYITSFRFLANPAATIEEGYKKFGKGGVFCVPTPINWLVALSPDQYLQEAKGPNGHLLSAEAANDDISSADYLLNSEIFRFPYHMPIIRGPMIKNTEWLEEMRNEIIVTCEELIPISSEWKPIMVLPTIRTLITRSFHRIMFSDPELFLKIKKEAYAYLAPKIEQRLKGDTINKQDDLFSLFVEAAEDKHRNVSSLFMRVLHMNSAVVHTTSETTYLILMELAARQEYIQPLREEIETMVAKYGWSKTALSSMEKLESFMMETMRVNSPSLLNGSRKAIADYVLSNGICIPKGSLVTVVEAARHKDEDIYPNAKQFDGYRFYNNDKETTKQGAQLPHQFTTISPHFIIFGIGPNAW
ncbi:hypothetical protein Clacol_003529 [Clathrus columnatus]|uniref:Cytochrome P450 n=1 Tax=Clathrus columnatus TaxID=1419009 RepID=A0AAV5A6L2_9AGAM|nr:hypothetical protein Clacol_003529 [Clathrus columnatus]